MKAILFFLFFFVFCSLNSEVKILLQDDFSDNRNDWFEGDDSEHKLVIENGEYIFFHKREEGSWFTWNTIDIDEKNNFIIKATFQYNYGVDDSGYGLVWGLKDTENYYCFDITENGYFRYAKEQEGTWNEIIEWATTFLIDIYGSSNTIEIKKIKNQYEFYINNFLVGNAPFEPFFGNKVGFSMSQRMEITIDDLTIIELPRYKKIYNSNLILFENFSDNDSKWPIKDDEDRKYEIRDGKYYIWNKNIEKSWLIWYRTDIDQSQNFVIKTTVQKVTEEENEVFGLLLGLKDVSNYFLFYISSSGYYSFQKIEEGTSNYIIDHKESDKINGNGETNTLEIRRIGDYFELYINEECVDYVLFEPFPGDNVGFYVSGYVEMAVDDLIVQQLEKNYDKRTFDSSRFLSNKLYSTPEIRDNMVFLEYQKEVTDFGFDTNKTLLRKLMIGYMGATGIAEFDEQIVCIKVVNDKSDVKYFKAKNNDIQDLLQKLITEEEFKNKIIIEDK